MYHLSCLADPEYYLFVKRGIYGYVDDEYDYISDQSAWILKPVKHSNDTTMELTTTDKSINILNMGEESTVIAK